MYLKLGILAFAGLGAGAVIAAGIFAFLAIIGVFPRLIGVTHTAEHVILYETLLILGGCLVMSLAETLKALPILNRRIGLAVGLQYVILAVAAGKAFGSAVYFLRGFG